MDETFAGDGNENSIKRRNHAGPLPRVLYDLFLNCIRLRCAATLPKWIPSGPELKAAGFPKPKGGITRRERFKNWAERMDVRFNAETNSDLLVHKRTGKIIVPMEEFETVVRKVHSQGHYDVKKTFALAWFNSASRISSRILIQEKYTVGHRDFGIDKDIVSIVVETCAGCLMKAKFIVSNGMKNGDSHLFGNDRLPHYTWMGKLETLSMVANVPDSKCIWFDKSVTRLGKEGKWSKTVLEINVDFNSKLKGLVNELRGEIGETLKGSKEARDRLLKKISVTQFIIKEQRNYSAQLPTEIPEYNQQFIDDMKSLLESYKQDGKEQLFSTDMELLAEAYRGAGYSDLFIQSVEALIRSLTSR